MKDIQICQACGVELSAFDVHFILDLDGNEIKSAPICNVCNKYAHLNKRKVVDGKIVLDGIAVVNELEYVIDGKDNTL